MIFHSTRYTLVTTLLLRFNTLIPNRWVEHLEPGCVLFNHMTPKKWKTSHLSNFSRWSHVLTFLNHLQKLLQMSVSHYDVYTQPSRVPIPWPCPFMQGHLALTLRSLCSNCHCYHIKRNFRVIIFDLRIKFRL